MNNRLVKTIAFLLLIAVGTGSCKEHKQRYRTKYRAHKDYYHYRGAGHSF